MNQKEIDQLEMLIRRNYLVKHTNHGEVNGISLTNGVQVIDFDNHASTPVESSNIKAYTVFDMTADKPNTWLSVDAFIERHSLQVDSQLSERFHDSLEVDSHYNKEKGWTVGRKGYYYNSKGWRETIGEAEWFKSYDDMLAHMKQRNINVRSSASFSYLLNAGMMIVIINGVADTSMIQNVNSDDEAKVIIYNKYGVRL